MGKVRFSRPVVSVRGPAAALVLAMTLSWGVAVGAQTPGCSPPAGGPPGREICPLEVHDGPGLEVRSLNADGSVVVGRADDAGGTWRAFRWRAGAGSGQPQLQDLGSLTGIGAGFSEAFDVSADGTVVVGEAQASDGSTRAFRWRAGATGGVAANPQMQDLGSLTGAGTGTSLGRWVSAGGAVVVGQARVAGGAWRAFRWREGATDGVPGNPQMQDLGSLAGAGTGSSEAFDISADGTVVVGVAQALDGGTRAFVWRAGATGGVPGNPQMLDLGSLTGAATGESQATHVSADGQVVVGASRGPDGAWRAFRWRAGATDGVPGNPQMQDLGSLAGAGTGYSVATHVSADGAVVVGQSQSPDGSLRAFLWRAGAADGVPDNPQMFDLGTLAGAGTGFSSAAQVSADGTVVVGVTQHGGEPARAFRWRAGFTGGAPANPQMQDLGTLPGAATDQSDATHLSADGRVVVGRAQINTPDVEPVLWRAVPPPPLEFLGGGTVFGFTAACASGGWANTPHPARLRYGPGEVNGMPSQVGILFPSGAEHLQTWHALELSTLNYDALGRQMWTLFVLQQPFPRMTPVQRRITQPAGGTDIATATEVMLRLRVSSFGGIPGCGATVAGVLRRGG